MFHVQRFEPHTRTVTEEFSKLKMHLFFILTDQAHKAPPVQFLLNVRISSQTFRQTTLHLDFHCLPSFHLDFHCLPSFHLDFHCLPSFHVDFHCLPSFHVDFHCLPSFHLDFHCLPSFHLDFHCPFTEVAQYVAHSQNVPLITTINSFGLRSQYVAHSQNVPLITTINSFGLRSQYVAHSQNVPLITTINSFGLRAVQSSRNASDLKISTNSSTIRCFLRSSTSAMLP